MRSPFGRVSGGEGPQQLAAGCPRDGIWPAASAFSIACHFVVQEARRVTSTLASTKQIITRYYEELWNQWSYDLIPDLLSSDLAFRGSLGVKVRGHGGFGDYMRSVQTAFPDFHNLIDDIIVEWNRAAVRLTYTGTHSGPLFGVGGTGRRVEYPGVAIFTIDEGLITSAWVLGDTQLLWKQIGQRPPTNPA